MMNNEKQEAVRFIIWGIGLVGIGAFLVVGVNFILSLFTPKEFFLVRNLIVLVIGMACIIFSKNKSK